MARLSDIKVTERDFDFSSGGAELVEYQYAVAQRLDCRLDIGQGEWPLDVTFGVPYKETVFVKSPNVAVVASVFLVAILDADGVLKVNEYNIETDFVSRHMTCYFEVQTIWGPVSVRVEQVDMAGIIAVVAVGPLAWLP